MSGATDRRHFLLRAAAALAVSSTHGVSGATRPEATQAAMAQSRLIPGLCAFSFGPLFTSGELTFELFFQRAIELKAHAVDMTLYYLKGTDSGYLNHLRNLAFRNGLPFTGAACRASLLPAGNDSQESALAEVKKWTDITGVLGGSHLRIFPGKLPTGMSKTSGITALIENYKRVAAYAATKGVVLGMENQNGLADSSNVCLEIISRVNSPFAGLTLDISHFVSTAAQDYYSQIAACVPIATQTHLRSGNFDHGSPIDLDRICRDFAQAGYRGHMSVEGSRQKTDNKAR